MPELHLACISYFAPSQLSPVLPSQDSGCSLRTIFLPALSRTLPRRPSGAYLGWNCTCCSRRRFKVSRKWRRTRKKVPCRLAATCHPRDPLPPRGQARYQSGPKLMNYFELWLAAHRTCARGCWWRRRRLGNTQFEGVGWRGGA